jgi:VCBS repeat-containing protein
MHPTTLPCGTPAARPVSANAPHTLRPLVRFFAVLTLAALAFAFAPAARAAELHVEGPQDTLAQPPAELSNHCTLRKAIGNANHNGMASPYPQCLAGEASPIVDTIIIDFPGTITLTLTGANEDAALTGDLDITDDVIIIGHPDGTTIDAADIDRVFHVHPGVTLTLINIHITNGRGNGGGGGVRVEAGATLVLNGVTISSCYAAGEDGGGIENNGGTLNISNSTISGNAAAFIAGAIQMNGGTATITNSTITANSSDTGLTGGVNAPAGTTTLRSTVLVGNTNASIVNGIPNFSGVLESAGYNVIGDAGTPPNNGTFNAQPTDQTNVTPAQANLGPLAANGGPTPTHALLAGSVAIDKGHASGATTDQRGLTRPCDLASVTNAAGGDGGDAGAFELQGACGVTQQPPTANDDAANVSEDSAGNVIGVLGNDTDPNGDTLTVTSVTQGANGSVTNNGTSVSYTPNANFFGADSFTYTVSDGNGNFDSATVTVNVANVNDPPVANNDNYSMNQDTTLTVMPAAGVLANDTDIDNASLSATYVAGNGPFHGSLGLNADGSFTYTPDPGYTGTDTFDYVAGDGTDSSNLATVTVNVNDTQAPTVNCAVATALLWPPNSDLVNVGLTVSASDNDGEAPTVQIDVFSDEDDTTQLDGMSPDARDIAPVTLRLRAERSGVGDGRVYVIRIKATDQSNNTSYSYCTVVVPRSQSKADVNAVNAQAAAAVAAFVANGNNPPAGYFVVGDGPVVGPKQ